MSLFAIKAHRLDPDSSPTHPNYQRMVEIGLAHYHRIPRLERHRTIVHHIPILILLFYLVCLLKNQSSHPSFASIDLPFQHSSKMSACQKLNPHPPLDQTTIARFPI